MTFLRTRLIYLLLAALIIGCSLAECVAQGPRPGRFTFPPRSVRSRDIDQKHIKLELAFDFESQVMKGKATVKFAPFKSLSSISFDAEEMAINQATQGGKPLKFSIAPGKLEVQFAEPIEA